MNAFISTLSRDFSCAAAALLISLIVGASFVHSTNTLRSAEAATVTALTLDA